MPEQPKMTPAELGKLIETTQEAEFGGKCTADATAAVCKSLEALLARGKAAKPDRGTAASASSSVPAQDQTPRFEFLAPEKHVQTYGTAPF